MSMTPTVSFRFFPHGQVHVAFGDVSISPGVGTHRLVLPMKITGTWLDPAQPQANAPVLLTGTVWTDQPLFRWLTGLEAQTLAIRGYQASEELVVSMSDDQLIALERARGEDDLVLRLKLQATLLRPEPEVYPVADEEASVRLHRARWLELLDHVGSEVGIVVRVPSPLTDPGSLPPPTASADDAASLAQAAARLRQARAELRDHRWEHSVATCRRVLENLERLMTLPPTGRVFSEKAENRTQDQRWAAVFYDVKSLASAAHHDDEITAGFTWTRADAEAILAVTAGLLGRYTRK